MEEEKPLSKEVQQYFNIRLLGKQVHTLGYKDGKFQIVATHWEFEGKTYHFDDDIKDE